MMMNPQSVSRLLGITQKEMAMLLQVSRSQLAMFEIGKGNLPARATKLLGQLLALAESAESNDKSSVHAARRQSQRQQQLERLLQENEYQRLVFTKKVAAAERKATAQERLKRLAAFIGQRPDAQKRDDAANIQFLVHMAKAKTTDAGAELIKYQLKLELLDVEKKYLESQLQKR